MESDEDLEKQGRTRKHKVHEKIYLRSGVQRISSKLEVNKRCISTRRPSCSSIAKPRHEYTNKSSISKMKHKGTIGTPPDGDTVLEGNSVPEEPVSSSYKKETSLSGTRQSSVEPVKESRQVQDYEPAIHILHAMGEVDEAEWSGVHRESHQPVHGIPGLLEGVARLVYGDTELNINGGKPKATRLTTTGEVSPRPAEIPDNTKDDSTVSAHVLIIRESNELTSQLLSSNRSSKRLHSQENVVGEHSQQHTRCVEDLLQSKCVPQKESQTTDVTQTDKVDEEIVSKHEAVIGDNEFHVKSKGICCDTLVGCCCVEQIENTPRDVNTLDQDASDNSEEGHDIIYDTLELDYDKHYDNPKQLADGNHGACRVSQSIIKRWKRVIQNASDTSDDCETSTSECDCLGTTETDSLIKIRQDEPHENSRQLASDTTPSCDNSSEFESPHWNSQSSNDGSDESKQCSPWIDVPVLPTSASSSSEEENMTPPQSDTGNSSTPDLRFHVTMSSGNVSGSRFQGHSENTSCCFPSDPLYLESDYERLDTFDGGGVSPTYVSYDVLSDLDSFTADGFEFNHVQDDLVTSASDCCVEGYLNILEAVNRNGLGDQEPIEGFSPIQECIGQDSMLSSTRLEIGARGAGRLPTPRSQRGFLASNGCGQYNVKSNSSFTHSLGVLEGSRRHEEHISLSPISPIGVCSGGLRTVGNQGGVYGLFDAHENRTCPRKDTPSSCLPRAMTQGWTIGNLFPVDDVFLYHNESVEGLENSSMSNPSRGSNDEFKFDDSENSFSFDVFGHSPGHSPQDVPSLRNRIRSRFESPLSAPRMSSLFNGRDPTLPKPQRSPTGFVGQNPNHSCPLASSTPRKCQEYLRRRSSSQARQMEDFSVQDTVNLFLTMTSPLKSGRTLFL